MRFTTFSNKQLIILTWWTENSPYKDYDGIIADGSIRAGKTLSMTLSFVFWAMKNYSGQQFGMSGKAVGAFNRNITFWLIGALKLRGYKVQYNASDHYIYVKIKNKETNQIHENWFYIFGGTDERSYQFIQGMTAAGWFFDEAALQPESFVNQAIGRCSVDGAKIWFNCNPDKPLHWFKKDFIDNASEKNLIHVHFLMEDNPSLSKKVIDRYKSMYSGVFYLRYILGQWALAEGIIYDMITDANYYTEPLGKKKWQGTRYISIDYGTINPVSVHNYYDCWDVAYCDDEYYYDSKKHGKQKTDEEIADDIESFIAREPQAVERIIIDPSAASLKATLRNRGWLIKDADNEVLAGIRITASAFQQKKLLINKNNCPNMIEELGSYIWDEKSSDRGVEKPVKENDHACDDLRYFVKTIMGKRIEGRI